MQPPPRPYNVIILHADEMRGDCAGFAGNSDVRTPHLDAFAARATMQSQHFTVHGKCVPSRVAMMTGRYSHTDGLRTVCNENVLPASAPCLMKTLRACGYEAAVFGHDHCWENFWGRDNIPGSGATDYHSFTQGEFAAVLTKTWPAPAPPPGARPSNELPEGYAYRGRVTRESSGFSDDNRAEQAIHYLERVRDRSRPFFLQLNLSMPHPAYQVEEPWFSLHDPATLKLFPGDLPRHAPLPLVAQRRVRTGERYDEAAQREVLACYYGMIAKVDHLLGRVLATLERQNLFENSIVVFTSDHGDFAGQYGLWEKYDSVLNDCLLHVPFLISAPGLPRGAKVDALSEHIDLPPTVLELLGLQPPPIWGIHGASLLPAIRGERRKAAVFADGGHEAAMRQRVRPTMPPDKAGKTQHSPKQQTYVEYPDSMARAMTVRTERWRMIVRETGGNELYDVNADPFELDNRYGDQTLTGVRAELMELLLRWRLRTDTDRPFINAVMA